MKNQSILLRLRPGDDFVYRLKGSKEKVSTYVNNLLDGAVVTHDDTIYYHTIDRLYFTRSRFYNRLGAALIVGGAGLFLIDEVNLVLVHGEKPDLNSFVSTLSVGALAAGIPMVLIRKRSQKITYKYHLMTIRKGSPFYEPDPSGYTSPFIDN